MKKFKAEIILKDDSGRRMQDQRWHIEKFLINVISKWGLKITHIKVEEIKEGK